MYDDPCVCVNNPIVVFAFVCSSQCELAAELGLEPDGSTILVQLDKEALGPVVAIY